MKFPEGVDRGFLGKKNPFHGVCMDIFWNYTLVKASIYYQFLNMISNYSFKVCVKCTH